MMKPEIKALWTAGLRSGEFEQGQGVLKRQILDRVCHCGLGVLCELAIRAGVPLKVQEHESTQEMGCDDFTFDGQEYALPDSVMQWAGLDTCDPEVKTGYDYHGTKPVYNYLSTLNDHGSLFSHLADLIEADETL